MMADLAKPLCFLEDYEHLTLCMPLRTSVHLPAFHRHILTPSEQAGMRHAFEEMKEVLTSGSFISEVQSLGSERYGLGQGVTNSLEKTSATGTSKDVRGKGKEKMVNNACASTAVDSKEDNLSKRGLSQFIDGAEDEVIAHAEPIDARKQQSWQCFDVAQAETLFDPPVDSKHTLRWVKDPLNKRRWERRVFAKMKGDTKRTSTSPSPPSKLMRVGIHWFEPPGPELSIDAANRGAWYPQPSPTESTFDCRKVVWLDEPTGLKTDTCKRIGCSHPNHVTTNPFQQDKETRHRHSKKGDAERSPEDILSLELEASQDDEPDVTGKFRKKGKNTDPAYRYTKPDREQEAADDALRPDFDDINPAKPGKIVDPTFKPQVEDEEIESPVKETKKKKSMPKKSGKKNGINTSMVGGQSMDTPGNTPVAGPFKISKSVKKRTTPSKKVTPKSSVSKYTTEASKSAAPKHITVEKKASTKKITSESIDGDILAEVKEDNVQKETETKKRPTTPKKTLASTKKATLEPVGDETGPGSEPATGTAPKANTPVKRPVSNKVVSPGKKTSIKKSPAVKGKAEKVAEEMTRPLRSSPRLRKRV